MKRTRLLTSGLATMWLASLAGAAVTNEDKYSATVPGGLSKVETADRAGAARR